MADWEVLDVSKPSLILKLLDPRDAYIINLVLLNLLEVDHSHVLLLQVKDVEKSFLKFDDAQPGSERECNIQVDIVDAGSWILKFRKHGLIFNNRDLVIADSVAPDTIVTFDSIKTFRDILKNSSPNSLSEAIGRKTVKVTGSSAGLEVLQRRIIHSISRSSSSGSSQDSPPSASSVSATKFYRLNYNGELIQPLKHGWLEKKRDIFTGWRPRYIVVYPGRVEYYINQYDRYPRDVISLLGAEVSTPKKCSVNGEPDHYSFTVEPKGLPASKTLKLASSLLSVDSFTEVTSWTKVFEYASKSSDPANLHYSQSPTGRGSLSFQSTGRPLSLPAIETGINPASLGIPGLQAHIGLPGSTSFRGPLESAKNLIRRVRSGKNEDSDVVSASFFTGSEDDDTILAAIVIGVGLVVVVTLIGWLFFGWNGAVIMFGSMGVLSLGMSLYLLNSEARLLPVRAEAIKQSIPTNVSEQQLASPDRKLSPKENVSSSPEETVAVKLFPVDAPRRSMDNSSSRPPLKAEVKTEGNSVLKSDGNKSRSRTPVRISSSGQSNPSRPSSPPRSRGGSITTSSDFNGVYKDIVSRESERDSGLSSASESHQAQSEVKKVFNVRKLFGNPDRKSPTQLWPPSADTANLK